MLWMTVACLGCTGLGMLRLREARSRGAATTPVYDVHFCMEYMGHHEAHHIFQMFERRAALGANAR